MLKHHYLIGGTFPKPVQAVAGNLQDLEPMELALKIGQMGAGIASPNPSVGCVLEHNGTVIGQGHTHAYGGWHGERAAVEDAMGHGFPDHLWNEVTAYVTLEPCSHFGKQPPCADLLVSKGIGKVVIAALDPYLAGSGLSRLQEHGIPYEYGVFKNEAIAWNLNFFLGIARRKIVYAAKWAQSLDGQLADTLGTSQWISGAQSRQYTHMLRQKYDGILVGAGTVMSDFPSLTVRDAPFLTGHQPTKIIFDPNGRVLRVNEIEKTRLLNSTFHGAEINVLYVSQSALDACDVTWRTELSKNTVFLLTDRSVNHFEIISDFKAQLASLDFRQIRGKPLQSILVEGGPRLLSSMVEQDEIDVFHTFIAPFFMGNGNNHLPARGASEDLTGNVFPRSLAQVQRYKTVSSCTLGEDIVMEYMPQDRFVAVFS